ncbi:hypothetical protein ACFVMC_16425 [Nocardia sp. NPDC127579]|uniref:hypothetical protein n=1 Tax=Nocardia sp. NPDC127579 TaxID=3345402 RepID=UPI0036358A53
MLVESTASDIDYVFGEAIGRLTQRPDAVEVAFDSGRDAEFDPVVGADGLHSRVHRIRWRPWTLDESGGNWFG